MMAPRAFVDKRFMVLDHLNDQIIKTVDYLTRDHKQALAATVAKLDALSPLKVIQRGYAIAMNEEGVVVKNTNQLTVGGPIVIRLSDGQAECRVDNIIKEM